MSNIWDEMRATIARSKEALSAADAVSTDMARVLRNRLRHVDLTAFGARDALRDLKRELRDFDMTTGRWSR